MKKKTKLLNDMSMMKPSELWKMAVDDRVRSLLKSKSSKKSKGKGKDKTFDPQKLYSHSNSTKDPCLKIRLNK